MRIKYTLKSLVLCIKTLFNLRLPAQNNIWGSLRTQPPRLRITHVGVVWACDDVVGMVVMAPRWCSWYGGGDGVAQHNYGWGMRMWSTEEEEEATETQFCCTLHIGIIFPFFAPPLKKWKYNPLYSIKRNHIFVIYFFTPPPENNIIVFLLFFSAPSSGNTGN